MKKTVKKCTQLKKKKRQLQQVNMEKINIRK